MVWLEDCTAINNKIRDFNWQAPNSTWQIVTNVVIILVSSLLRRNVLDIKFILKYIIVLLYELHSKLYGILNSKRSIALYPWRNCVLVSVAFVLGRVLIHFLVSLLLPILIDPSDTVWSILLRFRLKNPYKRIWQDCWFTTPRWLQWWLQRFISDDKRRSKTI